VRARDGVGRPVPQLVMQLPGGPQAHYVVGGAVRLSFRGHSDFPFAHPFDPLSAPRAGLERIRKVLCFPCNLVAAELHDAHGVGRLPVVRQNILGNPKIISANDSPHSEALPARLIGARDLYVAPTADSFA
jgi:hypothetical protein